MNSCVLIYLIPYSFFFFFWCLNCFILSQWRSLKGMHRLVFVSFNTAPEESLLSRTKCSRLAFIHFLLQPEISHFLKESWVILLILIFRDHNLGTKDAYWYWNGYCLQAFPVGKASKYIFVSFFFLMKNRSACFWLPI